MTVNGMSAEQSHRRMCVGAMNMALMVMRLNLLQQQAIQVLQLHHVPYTLGSKARYFK